LRGEKVLRKRDKGLPFEAPGLVARTASESRELERWEASMGNDHKDGEVVIVAEGGVEDV